MRTESPVKTGALACRARSILSGNNRRCTVPNPNAIAVLGLMLFIIVALWRIEVARSRAKSVRGDVTLGRHFDFFRRRQRPGE